MSESPRDPRLEIGRRLVREVLEPMKRAFVGKDEVIDLLGVSLLGGQNLFILGPPGTAKSALVQDLGRRLGGDTFEYLLTRFTEPNEIFGPFDIRRLREGDLVTNTEGMLPEASLVFLDELLNANSAILNSLLTVLNERVFRRGRETRKLNTLMVVGASNRLPEDDALGALFDRFLLRVSCDNVASERLPEVLDAGWHLDLGTTEPSSTLGVDDVGRAQSVLGEVDLTEVRPRYAQLVERLRQAGIHVSDRRAVKLQRAIAASALLCGRGKAIGADLWVVRYIWDAVEQRELIRALVTAAIGDDAGEAAAHPRARGDDAPDPEALARDLDHLADRLRKGEAATDLPVLRDRLGILAERCQWIADEAPRTHLLGHVEQLWSQLETKES